ncbi:LINE-1 retrotransposable element ORF2 protein [Linum perenne]
MTGSDHRPIRVELYGERRRFNIPCRFDSRWLHKRECEELIKQAWDINDCLGNKLDATRDLLSNWSKEQNRLVYSRELAITHRLNEIETNGRTETSAIEERLLKEELGRIWRDEEIRWAQLAKTNWLRDGDRNTKFFHATARFRKQRNLIAKLQNEEGRWITNERTLKRSATSFFENLFTKREGNTNFQFGNVLPSIVTDEINSSLTRPVDDDEIRRAVFSLGAGKSPGPDGFSGQFFRRYWDSVGHTLCQEVRGFFEETMMPSSWNETHIVLIPKVACPVNMSQFRPISCCNFRYKVVAKIMASRLKEWMPRLVNEMQGAFTGGRIIQDNIIIVHEVLHRFKIRTHGRKFDMMMKLDMRKAYDLVDWECLDSMLAAYGFSGIWRAWIRECVQTVKFSVLFNGQGTPMFSPTRGIRQGDPLSPFLFILMTNALSFLIEKRVEDGSIHGIKIKGGCPILSHCLFADDTVIFGKATEEEASKIINIINEYGMISGQEVNPEKSSIFFSNNTPQTLREAISSTTGFANAPYHSKYLGVPTDWGRSRKETFSYLIERMERQGQNWKGSILSHAGKETLIKAVIQAIPNYIMSVFLLPKSLTKKMDRILRNFFWAGNMNKRSIHWCNEKILCSSKQDGGLGFKNFGDFNLSLLGKQAWRMLTNPSALWVRLLKSLYFPHTDFLNASRGRRPSWIWSSICKAKEVIRLGAFKGLGSGRDISVANDPWIPYLDSFRITGFTNEDTRMADWIQNDRREWNMDVIALSCTHNEMEAIKRIPIGPIDMDDEWKWKHNKNGLFSVRSAYHTFRNLATHDSPHNTADQTNGGNGYGVFPFHQRSSFSCGDA